MIQLMVQRQWRLVLLCLLSQSFVSTLAMLHFNQQVPELSDAHLFDSSGGYLLLDVLRLEGKRLGKAGVQTLLLMAVSLPLLVLTHLQLLANCARSCCPTGSQLKRSALDVWGSALLVRAICGALSLGSIWLFGRASAALLDDLNAGLRWSVVGLAVALGVVLLLTLGLVATMGDHTQLSGLLVNGKRPTWRRRLLLGFWEAIGAPKLLGFRVARMVGNGILAATSVAIHRELGPQLLSSVLVQGLILLSILAEAWWYHALSRQALKSGLRPWLSDTN